MKMKRNSYIPQFMLTIVALIWGSGFIATSLALKYEITPFTMMFFRFSVAGVIMFIFFFKRIIKNFKITWRKAFVVGGFLFLGFAFQTFGLMFTTTSKNAFLTAMNVVFVPIIYSMVYKKKLRKETLIYAFTSFIGVGLLTSNIGGTINIGDVLSLLCAVLFAAHIFSIDYFTKGKEIDVITFVFGQFITASLLSFIMMISFESVELHSLEMDGIYAVLYLGVFSTFVAFFLQNFAQKYVDSNRTSIILANEAVFATILAMVILGEIMTITMSLGALLVFLSIIMSEISVFSKTEEV